MQEQLINTYTQLMTDLDNLPHEIAAAQNDLTAVKRQVNDSKTLLDNIEASLSLTIEGKNAEERKAKLVQALTTHQNYQRIKATLRKESEEADMLANSVDTLTRQYGAVCYQARLHAALCSFLGSAGAPVNLHSLSDVVFPPASSTRHNNNHLVTADDAAQIGL